MAPHRTPPSRDDGFNDLLGELRRAKAETLFRIAGVLEKHLATLDRIQTDLRTCTPSERPALVKRHGETRKAALEYRYYLQVQREIIGLSVEGLDERYRVPPPLV